MNKFGQVLSLLIKVLVLVAIIGVGVIIYQTCSGLPLIQKIDKTLPVVSEAPLEISTMTKNYMAQRAILNDEGSVTMYGWYDRVDGEWVFHEEKITLPKVLRPRIIKR